MAPEADARETYVRYPGEQIAVRVNGLAAGEPCAIRLARRWREASWEAWLETPAGAGAVVDTRTALPTAGPYTGADPDALFWSMTRTEPSDLPADLEGWLCSVHQGSQQAYEVLHARTLR